MIKTLRQSPKGETKNFFSVLFKLSFPVIFQNLLHSLVNLIDTVMVGTLGIIAVAAVGLSNQIYFILQLVMFGVASGISVFISQYWGKKDLKGVHKTIALGLTILVPIIFICTICVIAMPVQILKIFTEDTAVLQTGASYLRIVASSYVFSSIIMILGQSLRSTENVKLPLIATIISLAINVFLNAMLIFGYWIFPELGVVGAGLATSIARIIETFILIFAIYALRSPAAIKINSAFKFTKKFISRFIRTSSFVIITETLWGLGTTLFFAVYGRMSSEVVAAVNISKTAENLVLVFYWGFAGASAITVGKLIGQNLFDKARRYAYRFILTGLVAGIILGCILILISPAILSWYKVPESTKDIASLYLVMFSVFLFLRGSCAITTVGILRSGGDTIRAMLLDVLPL